MNPEMQIDNERAEQRTHWLRAASSPVLARIPVKTQGSLLRMFADPYLLEKPERAELVQGLRECVLANPEVSELRVLFGMALCVDFEVQDAIEELREGVRLAPDSFIAHLKMGELWMRLRVMEKAEEHTHQAALLARNMMQSELARRQAATIRTMVHNGIKRDGPSYKGPWHLVTALRKLWKRDRAEGEALAAVDVRSSRERTSSRAGDETAFDASMRLLILRESNPWTVRPRFRMTPTYPGVASKPVPAEVINLSGRAFVGWLRPGRGGDPDLAGPRLAGLAPGGGSSDHDPVAIPARLVQISDPQECADVRNVAGHHRHFLQARHFRMARRRFARADGGTGRS